MIIAFRQKCLILTRHLFTLSMPQINICNKITCNSPQLHYTALFTIWQFFPLYHFNKNRAYFPKNLDINQISCYNEFMQNLQTALLCEKSGRERLGSRFISTINLSNFLLRDSKNARWLSFRRAFSFFVTVGLYGWICIFNFSKAAFLSTTLLKN